MPASDARREHYIGRSLSRPEDARLVAGKGCFVDDIRFPGQAFAAILRSPHARARIEAVNAEPARRAAGVIGVLTAPDVLGSIQPIRPNWIMPGTTVPDRPVLADGAVRMVGEPVAMVVAETRERAYDALSLIEVDYEVQPAIIDEEAATADGAPLVHADIPNNVACVYRVTGGDCDRAFREADHVLSLRLVNQRLIPSAIEPRAVNARFDPLEDKLTVYLSSQMPHMARRWLAEALGWPEHRLRVVAPDVGGGFGSKMHFYPEEILCAFAAKAFGRPVKWTETRRENHVATTHGRAHTEYLEVAASREGRILGLRLKSFANMGAYLSNMATGIPTINCANQATGIYKIENYQAEVLLVFTNTAPVDAYRGAGRPEAAYIAERAVDAVAAACGLDPVEVRRRNLIQPEDFPYAPYGHPRLRWDSGNYPACLDEALNRIRYYERRREQTELRKQGRYIGIAVTGYTELCGVAPSGVFGLLGFNRGGWESAQVRVHSDGKVTVFSGSMSTGHGHAVTFAQIAADELELPIDDIDVVQGDTDRVPAGNGTYNSRSVAVGGSAVKECAARVRRKAMRYAGAWLDVDERQIRYANGVFSTSNGEESVSFAEVARLAHLAHLRPKGETPGLDEILFYDPAGMGNPNGFHAAVVEVDVETGEVDVLEYVAVDDAGVVINPLLATGQVHGGVVQGIGQALYEEACYADDGTLESASLSSYALPRAERAPRIETVFLHTPSPTNPLGAKGIGEAGCVAAPPVIVSAVCDALAPFGIRHIDMPLTPPKVWHAIQRTLQRGEAA